MFGNESEINRLKEQWMNYFPFKVYPGLGNHDYWNNINKCPDQDCLNRILKYFMSYVEGNLKFSLDYERSYDSYSKKEIFNGSLSYSWDECLNKICFHFVQLNYHPFYTKIIDSSKIKWIIRPSLNWLEKDLSQNANKPVIINFHAVDYAFNEAKKLELVRLLKRSSTSVNILAIMFAHYHEKFGLKETWCFNKGQTKLPLIYSGSIPANNYVLVQFSSVTKTMKFVYKIHAVNETLSSVQMLNLQNACTNFY